jgi:hypothetical protein
VTYSESEFENRVSEFSGRLQVVANGTTVAGTHVNYQNSLQAHDLQQLGVSAGTRSDHYGYDDRGRVRGSLFGSTN